MAKVEKIKFRKQFTDPESKRLESVYFGDMSPSDAARAKEYIERLITCRKFGTMPDETVVKWLNGLSDSRHEKLSNVALVKPRICMSLQEFTKKYLAKLELSESTMDIYRQSVDNLLRYFGNDRKPGTITRADATNYKIHLEKDGRLDGKGGYGKNSIWKKLQHANIFFREMIDAGLVRENPFLKVSQAKVNETDRKDHITADYALRAMEYAPNAEWRLMIALWRFGGLRRCCEVLRLRWVDIIWDQSLIRVFSSKTKKERFVPIFPEIMPPLLDCAEQAEIGAEWVIEKCCPEQLKRRPNRGGSVKAANLSTTFDKICRKAGLSIIPMIGNNMRGSCVKDLYSGKYPELRGRIELMGHILGHSPQVALYYYQRFSTDDFIPLVESFANLYDRECEVRGNEAPADRKNQIEREFASVKKCVKQEEKGTQSEQGFTHANRKTPCFTASEIPQNKGLQANYPLGGQTLSGFSRLLRHFYKFTGAIPGALTISGPFRPSKRPFFVLGYREHYTTNRTLFRGFVIN